MAKRILDWVTNGEGQLSLNRYNEDKKTPTETVETFNLYDLPQNIIVDLLVYGAKQKLADSGASESDFDGKVNAARKRFCELLAGKWTGERVNATGAAVNKIILANVKTAAKVVSLEGLMMKKMAMPESFTAEDQAKLDEFMAAVVAQKSKSKSK